MRSSLYSNAGHSNLAGSDRHPPVPPTRRSITRHEDADEILGPGLGLSFDDDWLKSAGLGPLPPYHAGVAFVEAAAVAPPAPPVKPGPGSGESQIGDIGRGSGRRSYRQQPWLSSLSVPQAPCARNPRRCQVLLTDRPECARARWTAIPYPGPLSGKRPRRARRTRVSGRSAPDRVVRPSATA
jgi:hypothetical protein